MQPVRKPTWQQATALVSLSTCGAMTGFAFAHGTVDDMTSPTRMPVKLMAVDKPVKAAKAAKAGKPVSASEAALRSAIVKVANYYLRMAQSKSPAEMEAMIWAKNSVDGADHGQSCAAFASLTLALGAQATGQQSWVSGGTTYPWPLHEWADVRVDPNPGSPQIISVVQDAQAHNRWHPIGDGYLPKPGDWVLFQGHVEVVTRYSGGVLSTIGGDSAPNLTVNAHTFSNPLSAQGVTGFVNNGDLGGTASTGGSGTAGGSGGSGSAGGPGSGGLAAGSSVQAEATAAIGPGNLAPAKAGEAAVPGTMTPDSAGQTGGAQAGKGTSRTASTAGQAGGPGAHGMVQIPGMLAEFAPGPSATGGPAGESNQAGLSTGSQPKQAAQPKKAAQPQAAARTGTQAQSGRAQTGQGQQAGMAAIPGLQPVGEGSPQASPAPAAPKYSRNNPPVAVTHIPGTAAQQAFISEVAPGAQAAQSRYGVPASVTIAQAIDESGWGQSALAVRDHNLFGIKGTGPAGADTLPTQEYQNGQMVSVTSPFRMYHNIAESIDDHGQLLASGASYQHAMANRHLPDAFATSLTGVYATDPQYGSNIIAIMRLYNLYQFDAPAHGGQHGGAVHATGPGLAGGAANSAVIAHGLANVPGTANGHAGTNGHGAANGYARANGNGAANGNVQAGSGAATIPGLLEVYSAAPAPHSQQAAHATAAVPATVAMAPAAAVAGQPAAAVPAMAAVAGVAAGTRARRAPTRSRSARVAPRQARTLTRPTQYVPQIPAAVTTAFRADARAPLDRLQPLYEDVASRSGIRWELLAACDWMQCQARPRYSPVYGEKLGTVNASGAVYRTKSEALGQCAGELVELAMAVYWIDITARRPLSVRDLARVFAAFRWGGLLKLHGISALEFPYSVQGLTEQHMKMRWPDVNEPEAPDKPGARFKRAFGAVPTVLCLGYPAIG